MAKKKIKELTPEELLEQAVVPEREQPYTVPENWVWTNLGLISKFERGITFPSSAKNFEWSQGLIACVRTANIQENLELEDLLYIDKSYMNSIWIPFIKIMK